MRSAAEPAAAAPAVARLLRIDAWSITYDGHLPAQEGLCSTLTAR